MDSIVLRAGRPYGGDPQDIVIEGGHITRLCEPGSGQGETVFDASDCIVLPGLVDLHTHLREPGREDAETIETGSRAAAKGGYTCVHAMANTSPVADTAGVVEQVWRKGVDSGLVDVRPVGAVTVGLAGTQLAEIGAMANSAAKVRVFSDDGLCVHDSLVMRRALEYVKTFGGVIAQHAQDPRLTEGAQMNEGALSGELGLAGWPAVAEEAIIARDVLLAQHVGSRLHVCHVSTAGSVDVIRWAKSKGINVTAEVTPHHLLLTEQLVSTFDPLFKVNPPLRREEDVQTLRKAVADGTIDAIATDHAPHPREDKDCEWAAAAMGMLGLETALGIAADVLVGSGLMNWSQVAQRMSIAPAHIGGVSDQGQPIEAGSWANICVWDPRSSVSIDPQALVSRSSNSPYGGRQLPGYVRHVFFRGRPTVTEGKLAEGGSM